jgi:peptidoglycan hydrolase CwlO-like protein
MRRTLAALLAVAVIVAAGCQDQQARDQNARLQAELDLMKSQQKGGGNDDLLKLLIANQSRADGDESTRKLNSLGEDMRAGLDDIKKQIRDNDAAANKRMDDIDSRIKKVSDLETNITTLKSMIETLESKVKNVDTNEVLSAHKEIISKDAELRAEKQAREAAEAQLANLKEQLTQAQASLEASQAEITRLMGEDISKHPMYTELVRKNRDLERELKLTRENLDLARKELEDLKAHLQKGSNPPPEKPDIRPGDYAFTGTVVQVRKGSKADGPSYLMVSIDSGNAPPKDTVLIVLDEKRNAVCKVKVVQHYHIDDKETLDIEEIGCATIDERTSNPVTNGDTVVWIKEEPKGSAGGD